MASALLRVLLVTAVLVNRAGGIESDTIITPDEIILAVTPGRLVTRTLSFMDPGLQENVTRSYVLYVPRSLFSPIRSAPPPAPLVLYYHGQNGQAMADAKASKYTALGEQHGFISAYPQGIGAPDGNCGTGWNVGQQGHDASTCTSEAWRPSGCDCSCCYKSCARLGVCAAAGAHGAGTKCGWSTCYSDVAFTRNLLTALAREFRLDPAALYVTGPSNGGMMTHYLAAALPHTFAAVLPVYGLPLVGHLSLPPAQGQGGDGAPPRILQLHDRGDSTIPWQGGLSGQGWRYVSLRDTLDAWAVLHRCRNNDTAPVTTPFDGGATDLACKAYTGCARTHGAADIMYCMFNGHHGDWPAQGEALTWWFFNRSLYGQQSTSAFTIMNDKK